MGYTTVSERERTQVHQIEPILRRLVYPAVYLLDAHYNDERYHESLRNLTPADVYYGRGDARSARRERIKLSTMALRRKMHAWNRVQSRAHTS